MSKRKISRRSFIGEASCAAIGTTTMFSSILNMGMFNALASPITGGGDDYKALVCILLSGGNDSYNMLVPMGASYGDYSTVRSNLAIPEAELLSINAASQSKSLGIHPAMPEIKSMYDSGKAAFISNIGTLIQPVTKQEVLNGTATVPLGLLSHSDQVMQWQTSIPQERSSVGWGGKMADILQSMNNQDSVSMNISLSGNNIFQRGNDIVEYSINSDTGGVGLVGYNEPDLFNQLMTTGVNSLLNQQYQDVFKKSYSGVIRNSIESNELFNEAVLNVPDFTTQFSDNYVSESLQMIARTIAARDELGMKRQTFFLSIGGFDNHDELLNNQAQLLTWLSQGLDQFYSALAEVGADECVTSFTISDFARTLTSNGNGTDHAWGGNALVVGGGVKGADVYRPYPDLALGSDLVIDNGGIIVPTTSADEYFAELALWFGVSEFDLPVILPNIGNFYSVGSGNNPIGFMNI